MTESSGKRRPVDPWVGGGLGAALLMTVRQGHACDDPRNALRSESLRVGLIAFEASQSSTGP